MSGMLDIALEYARRGELVLPLRENGKEPATANGFYDASINDAEIEKLFVKPTVNIGIRVGQESNIIVIDPDNKGGKDGRARLTELEARLGPLPLTRTIETRYGKHYYFKFPDEWRDTLIKSEYGPGLDIKANGYVVAPPSTVDGFTYFVTNDLPAAELPDSWVMEAVKAAPDRDDWARVRPRGKGSSVCEEHSISLDDVLDLPVDARKTGDGYLIKHPVHGATGKGNLYVNPALNLWCCYRHGTGGDPITWVAVREGLINCAEAGRLDTNVFKGCLDALRREGLFYDYAPELSREQRLSVDEQARWLIEHPKHLIAYYRSVIDDYHQGEWNLKTTMWRQTHRIAYHSATALLHSDMTGPSRGGKTALMLRFLTLLPPGRKEVLTTLTPKAVWYKTLRWTEKQIPQRDKDSGEDKTDKNGTLMRKVRVKESDPQFYVGKIIAILELSEMKDFGVLKALADEYEVGEYVHSTVIDHDSVELKIEGPHSVMTTSVSGIQNDVAKQVLNRFTQTPLDEPTTNGTANKLEMIADRDLDESTIDKDPRLPVLRRALELLWADGYNVAVNPPSEAVRTLVKAIDRQLHEDGFNITQIRDFHTFALNAAFEKRFARGDPGAMQIQDEDVREAWYILTTFGNFARGNLTRAEYKLLSAIPGTPEDALDASDLRETSGLGAATINDALRVKEDPVKGQGKFLQYNYVNYIQGDTRASKFYRVPDGNEAVKKITTEIEVDCKSVKPLNPCPYPYELLLDEILDSVNSVKFGSEPNFLKEDGDS